MRDIFFANFSQIPGCGGFHSVAGRRRCNIRQNAAKMSPKKKDEWHFSGHIWFMFKICMSVFVGKAHKGRKGISLSLSILPSCSLFSSSSSSYYLFWVFFFFFFFFCYYYYFFFFIFFFFFIIIFFFLLLILLLCIIIRLPSSSSSYSS